MTPIVSLIIVNYNAQDEVKRCLQSVLRKTTIAEQGEILVVDNNSSDGSVAALRVEFPSVRVIAHPDNSYFSGGVNVGLRASRGKFVWILGPDTEVIEDPLPAMIRFLDANPDAGAVSGRMYRVDGRLRITCSDDYTYATALLTYTVLGHLLRSMKRRYHARYRMVGQSRNENFETRVLDDSNILYRTDLLRRINGYDPSLRLYHVENDICLRMRSEGYRLHHLNAGKVVHVERVTVNRSGLDRIAKIYEGDVLRYYRKYDGLLAALLLSIGIKASSALLSIRRGRPQNFLRLFLETPTDVKASL